MKILLLLIIIIINVFCSLKYMAVSKKKGASLPLKRGVKHALKHAVKHTVKHALKHTPETQCSEHLCPKAPFEMPQRV